MFKACRGDLINRIKLCFNHIGHLQFASVPDRAEPIAGEVNYPFIIKILEQMGYKGFMGAEYKPSAATVDHLGWLEKFKSIKVD